MNYSDIEYPLRLCVEMMHYCAWSNDKTKGITPSELRRDLTRFFTEDQIEESRKILCGEK